MSRAELAEIGQVRCVNLSRSTTKVKSNEKATDS